MNAVRVSTSESFRKEGNSFYAMSLAEGMAPVLKKSKLEKASSLYNKAINAANNAGEKSSAYKNLGQTSWQITVVLNAEKEAFGDLCYYYNEAIINFFKAEQVGHSCKPASWIDHVKSSRTQCLESAFQKYEQFPFSMHMGGLERLFSALDDDDHKIACMTHLGQKLFRLAVLAMEKKDYKTSLNHLKECYRPIEELRKIGARKPWVLPEANVLSDDVLLHTASAESMQAIALGDGLREKALRDEEELKMSLVMEVLDWYGEAVIRARDIEVEHEAIACSRIGLVYDQILKMPCKAKKYFAHCLQLAHSAAPMNFIKEDWFELARSSVDRFQKESLVEQTRKEEELRQQYLKDQQPQLQKLRKYQEKHNSMSQHYLLLVNIYKAFPPKDPTHKLPAEKELKKMERPEIKKVLLKACLHYHPDKQDVTKYGLGWKYFTDEITKVLTNAYERYKG